MLSVAEIMTREPYTLGPDDTLQDAARLMHEHHIRHIPVVSGDGDVIGLVSHRDVLAASDSRLLTGDGSGTNSVAGLVSLSAVMTSPVQTVRETAELRAVAMQLHRHRIGCLPVTRGRVLVGIISASDFLEVAITLMEQLELTEAQPEDDF